ncbi:rod shape-determining protein [Endothiovibrio diazotrophicus]
MPTVYRAGIDLGTSRSTITTSTGRRFDTRTCVGFPKDLIARRRFGDRPLLGDEALDHRLAVDLVWPLAEGVVEEEPRALEATALILRHLIDEALPERTPEDSVYAAIGVPAQASIGSKRVLIEITREFIDKLLIVSEPFAVAYAIERFDECLIVDIGAGTTDICRMHGSIPDAEDQVTLPVAGNFLDQTIARAIEEKYPQAQISAEIVRRIKEKHGYLTKVSEPVLVTLNNRGIPTEYDLTEILRESCLRMSQPIAAAIQEQVGSFDPDFQARLRQNIIIAGGGSRLKGIDLAIENSLKDYGGANVECVQDAEYCGCTGALKMCAEMPDEYWERI